ncbi:hypothetical protein KCU88_g435, partial [Aureobasidium melanogenum]
MTKSSLPGTLEPILGIAFDDATKRVNTRLCDHGAGGGGLVLPVGLQNTNGLVVSAETVDSGFDKNETELGVLVLSVALEMLADGDGLKVLRDFRGETYMSLSVSVLLTSDDLDLGDTMAVSKDNTDLRRSGTLSGEFADVVDDRLRGALEPRGHAARVWDGRSTDTLSLAVKTTHGGCCVVEFGGLSEEERSSLSSLGSHRFIVLNSVYTDWYVFLTSPASPSTTLYDDKHLNITYFWYLLCQKSLLYRGFLR